MLFHSPFPDVPVVLAQLQASAEPVVDVVQATTVDFQLAIGATQEATGADGAGTVGWLAAEQGESLFGGLHFQAGTELASEGLDFRAAFIAPVTITSRAASVSLSAAGDIL